MKLFCPFFKIAAAAATALLVAGCVDVNKSTAPSAREYWQPTKRALPNEPLAIELPRPASAVGRTLSTKELLSLSTLVDVALENNPSTKQAWFSAKSAAAQLGEQQAGYYPSVTGTVSFARGRTAGINAMPPPDIAGSTATTLQPAVGINWLLFDFGKREAQNKRAAQALYAANFSYNQKIQDVVFEVQRAYFSLNAGFGQREAAQAFLKDAKANHDAAKAKLDNGLGTSQDALQAQAQLAKAQYDLDGATAQIEKARAELAAVLGLPVSSAVAIERVDEIPDAQKMDKQVGDLMAEALRTRPTLLAQYANLKQAQHAAEAARSDFGPRVVAFGQYDYNRVRMGEDYSYNQWSVGVALQWDLFTGFQRSYQLIDAKQQEKAAREALRAGELEIISQVWEYFYAYKSAAQQVESARKQLEAQQKAYDAISEGYRSGLNSFLDLMTAANDLASSRQMKVQAVGNLGTSLAGLAHATGNVELTTPESQVNTYREQK